MSRGRRFTTVVLFLLLLFSSEPSSWQRNRSIGAGIHDLFVRTFHPTTIGAHAWNCDAHALIAAIAIKTLKVYEYDYLTPWFHAALDSAFPTYNSLHGIHPQLNMRGQEFAYLACVPDTMRGNAKLHEPTKERFESKREWHYTTLCYSNNVSSKKDHTGYDSTSPTSSLIAVGRTIACPAPQKRSGLLDVVLPQLVAQMSDLARAFDITVPDSTKKHATPDHWVNFSYFLQLVGDAHQPLHMCSRIDAGRFPPPEGDRGGNLFRIHNSPFGHNLHDFWDSIAGLQMTFRGRLLSDVAQEWIDELSSVITEAEKNNTDVYSWIFVEGRQNCDKARRSSSGDSDLVEDAPLPEDYVKMAQSMAKRQIVLAGHRLGRMLKRVHVIGGNWGFREEHPQGHYRSREVPPRDHDGDL